MDAFNAVIKKHPDIKLLDAKHGNWNRDDAFKVMQDYLTRFKQIDAVWAADDDMAVGVLKAIEQAKRNDIKIVFGGAGTKGMVKTLMDGSNPLIQANVSYSPKFIYDAIKLTAEARLKGEKLPANDDHPVGADHEGERQAVLLPRLAVLIARTQQEARDGHDPSPCSPANGPTCRWRNWRRWPSSMGYDGLELACWGDHFNVQRGARVAALRGGQARAAARRTACSASRSATTSSARRCAT